MSHGLPVGKIVYRKIGRHQTKNKAIANALSGYVAHCEQVEILDLFGTIDFDPTYDYKAERRRKDSVNRPSGRSE